MEDVTFIDFHTFDYLYGFCFDVKTMRKREFLVDRNGMIIRDNETIKAYLKKVHYE